MKAIGNSALLTILSKVPTFQSITSKISNEDFTNKAFEAQSLEDVRRLVDFYEVAAQFILNQIRGITVNIPEMYKAIVNEYSQPYGGITQRMISNKFLKPVSPAYMELPEDGEFTKYPGVMRRVSISDYFFTTNFNYQNTYTMEDYRLKQAFTSENGIWNAVAEMTKTFDDAYAVQKYELVREALSKAINSTEHPLKDTQVYTVKKITRGDTDAAQEFMETMENLGALMKNITYTPQFNSGSAEHYTPLSDYVLLVRGNKWNAVNNALKVIYHNEFKFPFKVVTVNDFGGLVATTDGTLATALKPVYSTKGDLGIMLGYNASGLDTDPITDEFDPSIKYYDPNADICAVLVEKGIIFTTEQNNYLLETWRNVRHRTTHFWASQPEVGIHYDANYDMVVFKDTNTESTVD